MEEGRKRKRRKERERGKREGRNQAVCLKGGNIRGREEEREEGKRKRKIKGGRKLSCLPERIKWKRREREGKREKKKDGRKSSCLSVCLTVRLFWSWELSMAVAVHSVSPRLAP